MLWKKRKNERKMENRERSKTEDQMEIYVCGCKLILKC